eukprot:5555002-Pleurochrysis_carterae.AAC.1
MERRGAPASVAAVERGRDGEVGGKRVRRRRRDGGAEARERGARLRRHEGENTRELGAGWGNGRGRGRKGEQFWSRWRMKKEGGKSLGEALGGGVIKCAERVRREETIQKCS